MQSAEDVAREVLGCVPYHQPRWADGTEGKSWCRTHRHAVNEWPCPEQKALADTLAAWCAEVRLDATKEMQRIAHVADAEVRADERAKVLGRNAVLRAWTNAGPRPDVHKRAKDVVRKTMPVLARALDEDERGLT